jgi:hypothetical protein
MMSIRHKTASKFEQARSRLHESFPYIISVVLMIALGTVALLMMAGIWNAVVQQR